MRASVGAYNVLDPFPDEDEAEHEEPPLSIPKALAARLREAVERGEVILRDKATGNVWVVKDADGLPHFARVMAITTGAASAPRMSAPAAA